MTVKGNDSNLPWLRNSVDVLYSRAIWLSPLMCDLSCTNGNIDLFSIIWQNYAYRFSAACIAVLFWNTKWTTSNTSHPYFKDFFGDKQQLNAGFILKRQINRFSFGVLRGPFCDVMEPETRNVSKASGEPLNAVKLPPSELHNVAPLIGAASQMTVGLMPSGQLITLQLNNVWVPSCSFLQIPNHQFVPLTQSCS